MTKLPCGCDEKEVIISNIKGTIDYYEKDIEWVGLAQKRLNKVIEEGISKLKLKPLMLIKQLKKLLLKNKLTSGNYKLTIELMKL